MSRYVKCAKLMKFPNRKLVAGSAKWMNIGIIYRKFPFRGENCEVDEACVAMFVWVEDPQQSNFKIVIVNSIPWRKAHISTGSD